MVETISREVDLAWLAGIIEGEGCIYAYLYKHSILPNFQALFIRVQITNNDPRIIQKATRIMSEIGVGYAFKLDKIRGNRNQTMIVIVAGKGRVKKLLTHIRPYLSGKSEQADLLLRIIEVREEMTHRYEKGNRITDNPVIISLVNKLQEAKKNFPVNPSETIRRANYPLTWKSEDIVRTA